ncbi:MAG: hypothetical protein QOK11_2611 [Pseudonocardiales bacterium]|nr:hypothetical protein [Pseudonocardiales bacterium]
MRQNAKRGAVAVLVLALAAGLVLFMKVYNQGSKLPAVDGMGGQPGSANPSLGASPAPSKSGKGPGAAADVGISSFPASLTRKIGRRTLPGMPTHTVRMEVTAQGSVASLGYLVPTSDVTPYGVLHRVTQPWSKTLTAVGTIYLAGIFIQNGRDATSVTCTIYIDGKVADQQTFVGPYKRGICIA